MEVHERLKATWGNRWTIEGWQKREYNDVLCFLLGITLVKWKTKVVACSRGFRVVINNFIWLFSPYSLHCECLKHDILMIIINISIIFWDVMLWCFLVYLQGPICYLNVIFMCCIVLNFFPHVIGSLVIGQVFNFFLVTPKTRCYLNLRLVSSLNNTQNSEMNFHENMTLTCWKSS
jgi:hypothetical protein